MCAIQPQQGAQNWKRVEIPMVNFERQFFISIDRLRSPTLIILAAVGILGLGGAGAHAQIDSMIQAC
jgi:hypothetical protein